MTTTASHSSRKPKRIGFFGHFGTLNSGNESTLLAILARLRRTYPDGQFLCICTNPDVVAARDDIEAVPITTRAVRVWDRDSRLDRRLGMLLVGVGAELGQYVRAFRVLEGTELLVVPATGLVTDAYGLSGWGPYNQLKWSLMAKLRGCRVLFVSVGAGPIDSTMGRILVKRTLSLADYRSFRDAPSLDYVKNIGFSPKNDRVYPDLVFSLPDDLMPPHRNRTEGRRVVGIGLMLYAGKYSVRNPRQETFMNYLESLVVLVRWLLAHDYDIRLLLGDGDTPVIDEFKTLLRARLGSYDEGRVVHRSMTSVHGVLAQLAATDVVVATRFHNILLSLLLHKPVVAISFHHKCSALMSDVGLSKYCHDINHISPEKLIAQFEELEASTETVERIVARKIVEYRKALDDQYDHLFNGR